MSNNKQNENNNAKHQFSNAEPLTHAQKVAVANKMSNNKQSSVEILEDFFRRHCNPSVCDIEWNDFNTTFLEAKAMHKEEQSKFTIDYFNWLHNNQYKYNPKVKMYQKMMINETLFFTIEELMIEFNKTQ